MNPYETLMRNLRDAGYDLDQLADAWAGEGKTAHCVVRVVRNLKDGQPCFIHHSPGDTVVAFEGFLVTLERLALLIDREVARDWGL
jgi:hypothetical protein